ncbi:MAG: ATP phosphoribosyltransferase regulatory subunit [Oscillospiraceae bacterium]|nr:ATP phosphoribosyltransferase regulatory subunit [Oscillospiraceae bacterium]
MQTDKKILNSDERAVFALRSLHNGYGYQRYKMSRFEEYDLYVRNKDFLLSDQVITFTDHSGTLLALKPDVTLSIIKNTQDTPGTVQKFYYNENVYRVAKGSSGFQEIMQAGLECIGDLTDYEIGEVVLLAAKSLSLIAEDFVLDISHMGLVSAVLEQSGLSGEGRRKALACLHGKNRHELQAVCAAEGARAEGLMCLLDGDADTLTGDAAAAWQELRRLRELLEKSGYAGRVRVDFSVGNDLKYYSGVVFNGYIDGVPESVLSGGRYDKLLRKMGRQDSAVGFAIYVDLLQRLEKAADRFDTDAVLLYNGEETETVMAVAERLRTEGTVLAARQRPVGRAWRRLYEIRGGEAVLIENNG